MRILVICFLMISSLFAAPKCVLKSDSYNGRLYDFLNSFYSCSSLGRSFVFDINVERQLPLRVSVEYSRENYLKVLRGILDPLDLRVVSTKYSDVITKKLEPVDGSNSSMNQDSKSRDSDDSISIEEVFSVVGDSVSWLLPKQRQVLEVRDSIAKENSYAVPVRLEMALFSADSLQNYGIEEPDFLATVTPKLNGPPAISLFSYGVKLGLYNDTLSDHQDLSFSVLDSASLTVGPRVRYADATYSDGKITSSNTKDEQYGLSCNFRRSRDTLSYSCSYSRNCDTRDLVSFSNSLRVGESTILNYGLNQTVTTRGGGLFWFIPPLSNNKKEQRRYILVVTLVTG